MRTLLLHMWVLVLKSSVPRGFTCYRITKSHALCWSILIQDSYPLSFHITHMLSYPPPSLSPSLCVGGTPCQYHALTLIHISIPRTITYCMGPSVLTPLPQSLHSLFHVLLTCINAIRRVAGIVRSYPLAWWHDTRICCHIPCRRALA